MDVWLFLIVPTAIAAVLLWQLRGEGLTGRELQKRQKSASHPRDKIDMSYVAETAAEAQKGKQNGRWQRISLEEAQDHPLYGIGGWLLVFSIGLVLGFLKEVGSLQGEARNAGMSLGELLAVVHPAITFAKIAFSLQALLVVVIFWLMFAKHASFRNAVSALILASWPVVALVGMAQPFPGLGKALAESLIVWVVSSAVWVTYLQRSKRVRVTFEQSVLAHSLSVKQQHQHPATGTAGTTGVSQASVASPPAPQRNGAAIGASPPTFATTSTSLNHATQSMERTENPTEECWAQALAEFESTARKPGVWAEAFARSGGNESAAKAAYLLKRASELHAEYLAKLESESSHEETSAEKKAMPSNDARSSEEVARRRLSEQAILRKSAEELAASEKGKCPNGSCGAIIPLRSQACPNCGALFEEGAAWKVLPLRAT